MDWRRLLAVVAIIISAGSTAIAYTGREAVMTAISAIILILSVVNLARGSMLASKLTVLSAFVATVCSCASIYVLHQSEYMSATGTPALSWTLVFGLVHAIAVAPATFSFLATLVSVTGASFNWILVLIFGTFVGMGLELPGFILEYATLPAGTWVVDNFYITFEVLVAVAVMLLVSLAVSLWMRGPDRMITPDGMVVCQ